MELKVDGDALIVNVDAACDIVKCRIGMGVVIRDVQGQLRGAMSSSMDTFLSPFMCGSGCCLGGSSTSE